MERIYKHKYGTSFTEKHEVRALKDKRRGRQGPHFLNVFNSPHFQKVAEAVI